MTAVDALFSDPRIDRVLDALWQVPGWPKDPGRDESYVRSLMVEFPSLDLAEEVHGWAVWLLDNPDVLKGKVNWRSRFRTWAKKEVGWGRDRRERAGTGGRKPVAGQGRGGGGTGTLRTHEQWGDYSGPVEW